MVQRTAHNVLGKVSLDGQCDAPGEFMYQIIDTCTACGLCLPECPIDAIEAGTPVYIINDTCCDFEDCLAVCPENAIVLAGVDEGD